MNIQIEDWLFQVDVDATFSHTTPNSLDHCECGYCRNYYVSVDMTYPNLRPFLSQFGVVLEGPSELMPFEPTLMLACYRVQGKVLRWGQAQLYADSIPVMIEAGESGSFLLWVGELALPWCLNEPAEDVVSPANTTEFMERMQEISFLRHAEEYVFS